MSALFRNSRIKLSPGLLFWREVGEGPAVIFLHGSWDEGSQWVEVMERLSDNWQCFAPDLLGFGESDRPSIHYSINVQIECLAEYFRALKLDSFYLVGHSLGAWVATRYALENPDRVLGLVLLAPEGIDDPQLLQRWQKATWLVGPKSFWTFVLKALLPVARWLGKAKSLETLLETRSHLLEFRAACQMLFLRRSREIQAECVNEQLGNLTVPTLLLSGRPAGQDSLELDILHRAYLDGIPNAQQQFLPSGESNWPRSAPDAVARAIAEFVRSSERSPDEQKLDRDKNYPQ
ncbi:alpha/beta fold hydrolase [Roseofilum casamattae]|uniref:Alpha/beta hydrolase n=1 Tax=Roseofilum casamattae BLCC-M143 TaxID=3022442 RepID=A0ABT7BRW4_9CYAN|nr:alpha/beta hydrolase [Roseofilum casamattae]MDJ1181932.1 alpha/beta hydrolase [Roseofilum casamattae BLCC-M143]